MAQPCVGKIHYVFYPNVYAELEIGGRGKAEVEVIELFIKVLPVPVGFAAAKQSK